MYQIERRFMCKKPGFLQWLFWEDKWRTETKEYFKDDFFVSAPINTPLHWTKDIIYDTYKVTMDIYKQIVIVLATALFSSALWTGLIVRTEKTIIDFRYLIAFWIIILVILVILHYKTRYRIAVKDQMLTVILEHDCTAACKGKHFPEKK